MGKCCGCGQGDWTCPKCGQGNGNRKTCKQCGYIKGS